MVEEKNKHFIFEKKRLNPQNKDSSFFADDKDFWLIVKKFILFSLLHFSFFSLGAWGVYVYLDQMVKGLDFWNFVLLAFLLSLAVNIGLCLVLFIFGMLFYSGYLDYINASLRGKDRRLKIAETKKAFFKFFHNFWTICFWIVTFYYVYWLLGKFFKLLFQGRKGTFGGGGASGRW